MECFLNIRKPYYATYEDVERHSEMNDKEASRDFTDMLREEYDADGVYYNGDLNQEYMVFSPPPIKSATENIGTFNKTNNDIRYHSLQESGSEESNVSHVPVGDIAKEENIEEVNKRYNAELQVQIKDYHEIEHINYMGMPSNILLSTGIPNVPIEMTAKRLHEKSKEAHHPFDISQMKDLVKAIHNPLVVFKEKVQNLINQQRTNLAEVKYLDLDYVTKLKKYFDNPNINTKTNSENDIIN